MSGYPAVWYRGSRLESLESLESVRYGLALEDAAPLPAEVWAPSMSASEAPASRRRPP